jgi:hypothetical protein
MDAAKLEALLQAYSAGKLDQLALQECTGLWCGDILSELATRGLRLPVVDSDADFSSAQRALHGEIFS